MSAIFLNVVILSLSTLMYVSNAVLFLQRDHGLSKQPDTKNLIGFFKKYVILADERALYSYADRGMGGGMWHKTCARHRHGRKKSLIVEDHFQLFMCFVVYVYDQSMSETRLFSSIFSKPRPASRFPIVPVDSSAANIPSGTMTSYKFEVKFLSRSQYTVDPFNQETMAPPPCSLI